MGHKNPWPDDQLLPLSSVAYFDERTGRWRAGCNHPTMPQGHMIPVTDAEIRRHAAIHHNRRVGNIEELTEKA